MFTRKTRPMHVRAHKDSDVLSPTLILLSVLFFVFCLEDWHRLKQLKTNGDCFYFRLSNGIFHFNFSSNIPVAVQFPITTDRYFFFWPSSLLLHHLFGVPVHCFHEGAHVLGLHVGVEAVAQVGDVAPRAEPLQHLLHDLRDPLLGRK